MQNPLLGLGSSMDQTGLDLLLLNTGSLSTCVRCQGESVIGLSWTSSASSRPVIRWHVIEEVMSDNRDITMKFLPS